MVLHGPIVIFETFNCVSKVEWLFSSLFVSFRIFPYLRCYFGCWLFVSPPLFCLQSHRMRSTVSLILQKGHSLKSCLFMMYPCVAKGVARAKPEDYDLISYFHLVCVFICNLISWYSQRMMTFSFIVQ
jgi:hypothetical protein